MIVAPRVALGEDVVTHELGATRSQSFQHGRTARPPSCQGPVCARLYGAQGHLPLVIKVKAPAVFLGEG